MKDYKTKTAFESAFKKFVTNFDETKIWFVHPSKSYNESQICFVEDGKLKKFPVYKSEYYIQLDGWRFIEFLETGKFPKTSYVMVYADSDINPADIGKVFEFEFIDQRPPESKRTEFQMFHYCNLNVNKFLEDYRIKYPNCGLKHLPKPGTSSYPNSEF